MKNLSIYKRLVAIPTMLLYLEILVHITSGTTIKYLPIYFGFTICYGAILTAIIGAFGHERFGTGLRIVSLISSLLFATEFFLKKIFQTFYPVSMLKTAAGNHLETFFDLIVNTFISTFFILVLFFLPAIIVFLLTGKKKLFSFKKRFKAGAKEEGSRQRIEPRVSIVPQIDAQGRAAQAQTAASRSSRNAKKKKPRLKSSAVIILSLALAIAGFFLSLFIVQLPSKEDVTPKMLYHSDADFNEQAEQLGLLTMLRLDIKHMIWPAEVIEPDLPDDPIIAEPEPEPEAVYNVMNFDFDAMDAASSNKNVQWLSSYFRSRTGTKQNDYTGKFKGYNVIFITVEGLTGYAVSQEYTPNLYKLTHEGFVFTNFYTALHFTSTSNGECQNLLGLYPKNGSPITMTRTGELKTNCYFSLAQQLGRLGYVNKAYHNNQYDLYGRDKSHKNLGYDYKYGATGLYVEKSSSGKMLWPQKDSVMIDHTVDEYINGDDPFNIYYLTISAHTPYSWNYASNPHKEELADAPYSDRTKSYIASIMECDKAIENLIAALTEAGKLDKTLIVLAPDHVPYADADIIEELAGKKFGSSEALTAINESNIDFEVYRSCCAIWNSRIAEFRPKVVDKVCCQVDLLPTVSNLLGLEYDSRMLSGSDMLSDEEGMVVFSSRCWRTDKGFYNRFKQTFTPNEGAFTSDAEMNEYVEATKKNVANRLDATSRIIENNYYDFAIKYLTKAETAPEASSAE